jgi:hypothetical protein
MIRPVSFRMNEQTAVNNFFQKEISNALVANKKAQEEFDSCVALLRKKGIDVLVMNDTEVPETPDAIFPNNWISFHHDGTVAVYPMFAENRRKERREDVLSFLEENGFQISNVVDYTSAETEQVFLEGTGSLVLDRKNRKAYCALSDRSDESLFIEFCEDFDYHPIVFRANQTVSELRKPIYHTNVMMAIGSSLALICTAAIDDKKERKEVVKHLLDSGKEIINLSEAQIQQFAGNMLEVRSFNGEAYLVMSATAFSSLQEIQIERIKHHVNPLVVPVHTIETCGGGGVRCMMAAVFLPKID